MKKIITRLNRWPRAPSVTAALFAAALVAFSGPGFAAKGGEKGPPTGGEAGNNMSTPAIQTESASTIVAYWTVPATAELGVHYSYGCAAPQSNEQFNYPNTSCVDNLDNASVYYDAAECVAAGNPCEGQEVSRIYWQKVVENEWWADDDGISESDPNFAYVDHVDWGDALEAVSWNERSVIRVETQPYSSTIPGYDPTLGPCGTASGTPEVDCKVGFQMWHVAGQGITEHWGVRATDAAEALSFNYDSPFQIIKSTNARLNLTKMAAGDALCSMPGESEEGDLPPAIGDWNGSEWGGTCTLSDAPYSVETSVGGKYVYGYNWRMRDVDLSNLCSGWLKTGFWRLTFYAPEDVMFDDAFAPNVAPPAVPSEVRALPRCDEFGENCVFNTILAEPPPVPEVVVESEDPTADDRLYRPVIDPINNLTYLDICIVAKEGGGANGGGGGGGKPASTMKDNPNKGKKADNPNKGKKGGGK